MCIAQTVRAVGMITAMIITIITMADAVIMIMMKRIQQIRAAAVARCYLIKSMIEKRPNLSLFFYRLELEV
jgi:hypothetical protein